MSDKEYFAVDAMSASMLKAGAVSMKYMQYRKDTPMVASSTMINGSFMHMATLEPMRFADVPEVTQKKRSAALTEEHGELGYLPAGVAQKYLDAATSLHAHPKVVELGLFQEGEPEAEIYWDEDGKPCKCKVDWLGPDYWIEYKTTANLDSFQYTSEKMFYNLQLGWYHRGVATLGKAGVKCYVVVQEQKAPFDVKVMKVSSTNCKRWFRDGMEIYDTWLSGDRSGAYSEIEEFELSMWAEDDTIDMQGIDDQLEAMMPEGVRV